MKDILNLVTLNRIIELALSGIQNEYPNALEHFFKGQNPRAVHPAFYGCYDWHSAVHTHWMLIKLLSSFPDLPNAAAIRAIINSNLTAENLRGEIDNFGQADQPVPDNWIIAYSKPGQPAFERPYGWGWLLQLAAELHNWNDPDGHRWGSNLQPLTQKVIQLYIQFLIKKQPPNREGQHRNTAFALSMALDYARVCDHRELEKQIIKYGLDYYTHDTNYSTQAEPGPTDFCSPALTEADFMRRVLPPLAFTDWFNRFLPEISAGRPPSLLQPINGIDHNDPFISHLDGLNLSRAWCMSTIATSLSEQAHSRQILLQATNRHAQEGVSSIFSGNYNSSGHWLATFVVYLLATTGQLGLKQD